MNAIEFDHVGKQYRLGLVSTGTFNDDLRRWWTMNVRHKEDPFLKIGETNDRTKKGDSRFVWALKDINFNVEQGDVVGIIGKNGAGKSTLLKLLSRVTTPSIGEIRVRGRIASLLEVGTGFHPEMTGRENIYMNGAIMGMTKQEITRKLDEIVDFSGCERYIDTPVKRYSSGMTVRLGFAIAAHLEPEILVVDEVLAVGDAEFQKKAIGKMQDVSKGQGRTVLFVSHNMAAVKNLCHRGVLLENGKVAYTGEINQVIEKYTGIGDDVIHQSLHDRTDRIGNGKIRIRKIIFRNSNNEVIEDIFTGDFLKIEFHVDVKEGVNLSKLLVGCKFEDIYQNCATEWASDEMNQDFGQIKNGVFCLEIPHFNMRPNQYYLYIQLSLGTTCVDDFCDAIHAAASINVISDTFFAKDKLISPQRGYSVLLDAHYVF